MRFLVRLIGSLLLAIAVVFAVGDIARSLADQATRLVSFAEALAMMGGSLEPSGIQSATVATMLAEIGRWSVSITAGVAGLFLLVVGRERKRHRRLVR